MASPPLDPRTFLNLSKRAFLNDPLSSLGDAFSPTGRNGVPPGERSCALQQVFADVGGEICVENGCNFV